MKKKRWSVFVLLVPRGFTEPEESHLQAADAFARMKLQDGSGKLSLECRFTEEQRCWRSSSND